MNYSTNFVQYSRLSLESTSFNADLEASFTKNFSVGEGVFVARDCSFDIRTGGLGLRPSRRRCWGWVGILDAKKKKFDNNTHPHYNQSQ